MSCKSHAQQFRIISVYVTAILSSRPKEDTEQYLIVQAIEIQYYKDNATNSPPILFISEIFVNSIPEDFEAFGLYCKSVA